MFEGGRQLHSLAMLCVYVDIGGLPSHERIFVSACGQLTTGENTKLAPLAAREKTIEQITRAFPFHLTAAVREYLQPSVERNHFETRL